MTLPRPMPFTSSPPVKSGPYFFAYLRPRTSYSPLTTRANRFGVGQVFFGKNPLGERMFVV